MTDTLLELKQLSLSYGGVHALEDISLRLPSGGITGLIGPNGAGKTSLFNVITGFSRPSHGEVHYAGQRIDGLPVPQIARQGIARTFQNLRVFPGMTVFDNVSIGALSQQRFGWRSLWSRKQHSAQAVSAATWAALRRTGLDGLVFELAANLSYGKRKYLEIARALALQPGLLILDEPAAGLNDSETAALADFLRQLSQEGLSLLLVEHDLSLVKKICDRVLVLSSGRLLAEGSPEQVMRDPAVITSYLGSEEA